MSTVETTSPTPRPAGVPVIDPNAIFSLETARQTLGLPENTLRREARLRRLRVSKRSGRIWITGRWLLEWLESGEVRTRPRRVRPEPAA